VFIAASTSANGVNLGVASEVIAVSQSCNQLNVTDCKDPSNLATGEFLDRPSFDFTTTGGTTRLTVCWSLSKVDGSTGSVWERTGALLPGGINWDKNPTRLSKNDENAEACSVGSNGQEIAVTWHNLGKKNKGNSGFLVG